MFKRSLIRIDLTQQYLFHPVRRISKMILISPSAARSVKKEVAGDSKPGSCFHCKQPGHWKKTCPHEENLNKQETDAVVYDQLAFMHDQVGSCSNQLSD